MKKNLSAVLILLALSISGRAASAPEIFVNPLRSSGYTLVPAAKKVQLAGREVVVDPAWGIESLVPPGDIAIRRLKEGAQELHGLRLDGTGKGRLVLRVAPGKVTAAPPSTAAEAYVLKISSQRIEITGNGNPGLLHGVQSLLDLISGTGAITSKFHRNKIPPVPEIRTLIPPGR